VFRYALCNEIFGSEPFDKVCSSLRDTGYQGIEIAPFTLGELPDRNALRRSIEDASLAFVGLHWLLVSPPGLHVTTPDAATRARSWNHVRHLIDLSADLAGDNPSIMVFGSPKQRGTVDGATKEQATQFFVDGLREVATHAEARGVTILVEALPANQCDVINTLAEASAVVDAVDSPAIATMFDTHNTADETSTPSELIERYFEKIRHVHLNEMDGRYPGAGDYNFAEVLHTLARLDYKGWTSIEVFDFTPGALAIARNSISFLQSLT
jgi:D-psicose/D-tagatose/L-ribulose 3-epimerase